MPSPTPNTKRPLHPTSSVEETPDAPDPDDLAIDEDDDDQIQAEFEESAQPQDENGVMEDMATLAVNPGMLEGAMPDVVVQGSAHFAQLEDSAIMLELSAGNMSGFDFLIQKYRKPIINFMYRMVHNQAVAEELAQEVFLRVYRSRETYRAEARFSTWLYRIATNLGVNYARDTRHERTASTIYLDEADSETGTTPDVADSTPGAEAAMLRRERLNAIREHVLALPERQRTAVLMHKYEGMDYKQIGDVLKLSESATKSLLFRAYQTLREKLKEFVYPAQGFYTTQQQTKGRYTMLNNAMNCKTCQADLPNLLFDPAAPQNAAARAHIAACPSCAKELAAIESTMSLLDTWDAPEVSLYFNQKLAVRLREEQSSPAPGWFEQLKTRLLLNTGRQFRPAMAGAMALLLIAGGGSFGISSLTHSRPAVRASATVNDLKILDRNEQALQQMDQLLQDDASANDTAAPPQS